MLLVMYTQFKFMVKLKVYLLAIVFILFPKIIFSQNDFPSNSYEEYFHNTTINYRYIEEKQTHDYSGNWDFDGDGIKDSIMFVGTDGAHLYFYLHIYLSSEKKYYDFEFLSTDNPRLKSIDALIKYNESEEEYIPPQFVVYDFNEDGLMDIYGQAAVGLPKRLVYSDNKYYNPNPIIVYYNVKKRKIMIENLVSSKEFSMNQAICVVARKTKKDNHKFYRTYFPAKNVIKSKKED